MPVCDPHARERFLRQASVTSWSVTPPMWYKPPTSHPHPVTSLSCGVAHPTPPPGPPARRASVQDLGTLHQRWAARRQSTFCRQSAVVRDPIGEAGERSESPKSTPNTAEGQMAPPVRNVDGGCTDEGRTTRRQHPPPNRRRKTVASLAIVTESATQPIVSEWQSASEKQLQQQSLLQNSDKIDTTDMSGMAGPPTTERRQRRFSLFSAPTTRPPTQPPTEHTPNYHWQQQAPRDLERLSRNTNRSPTVTSSLKRIDHSSPLGRRVSRRFSTILDGLFGGNGRTGSPPKCTVDVQRVDRCVTGGNKLSISEPLEVDVEGRGEVDDERDVGDRSEPETAIILDDSTVRTPSTSTNVPDTDPAGRLGVNTVSETPSNATVIATDKLLFKGDLSGVKLSKDRIPHLSSRSDRTPKRVLRLVKLSINRCRCRLDNNTRLSLDADNTSPPSSCGQLSLKTNTERVVINVSGLRFETRMQTLLRFPDTLLGDSSRRDRYYDPLRNEYFFDRDRTSFDSILYYYQSGGSLRRPVNVHFEVFSDELAFYQLGADVVERFRADEGMATASNNEPMPTNAVQRAVWTLLENPESSLAARIIAILSVSVIVLSIATFCLETLPELKRYHRPAVVVDGGSSNGSSSTAVLTSGSTMPSNPAMSSVQSVAGSVAVPGEVDDRLRTNEPFFIIETVCIVWFTIEFAIRFAACPDHLRFFKNLLNIIDLVAIIPDRTCTHLPGRHHTLLRNTRSCSPR